MRIVFKSPASVKRVQMDWRKWLDGATVVSSGFVVEAGVTKDSEAQAAGVATVVLSGGTLGKVYLVTNTITDSLGRTEQRSFRVSVLVT